MLSRLHLNSAEAMSVVRQMPRVAFSKQPFVSARSEPTDTIAHHARDRSQQWDAQAEVVPIAKPRSRAF